MPVPNNLGSTSNFESTSNLFESFLNCVPEQFKANMASVRETITESSLVSRFTCNNNNNSHHHNHNRPPSATAATSIHVINHNHANNNKDHPVPDLWSYISDHNRGSDSASPTYGFSCGAASQLSSDSGADIYYASSGDSSSHASSGGSTTTASPVVETKSAETFFHDQSDNIALHTQKGIDFVATFSNFIRDRCQIESEYAKQLRSLVKKYSPKKKEEDDYQFTYGIAFLGVLQELQDIAGQHETIGDNFKDKILRDIATTSKDFRDQRKQQLADAAKLQQSLDASLDNMYKTRKDYQRAFKEAEASQAKYVKAEGNMDLSRADLEKARNNAITRNQQQEAAKSTYAHQLQQTNEHQRRHYQQDLPTVLENLRTMDEARIAYIQRLIEQCVSVEKSVLPIITKCLEGMIAHAETIKPSNDSKMVVDRFLSGYAPRQDFEFEDMGTPLNPGTSNPDHSLNGSSSSHNGSANGLNRGMKDRKSQGGISRNPSQNQGKATRSKSIFGKISGKNKTNEEFKEDFSDLPPSQRCKKLREHLMTLEHQCDTKIKARDGLIRLKNCYTEQPSMGNADDVIQNLEVTNRQLDTLTGEINKFKEYLAEAESQLNVPVNQLAGVGGGGGGGGRSPSASVHSSNGGGSAAGGGVGASPGGGNNKHRSSMSEESVSSESSHGRPNTNSNNGQRISGADRGTPSSTSGTPRVSHLTGGMSDINFADEGSGGSGGGGGGGVMTDDRNLYNYADEPDAEPQGTAAVIYTFDGGSEGTVSVAEGEEVLLLEKDEGDGWTRVRKMDSSAAEGFVPSSYLDCKWYPNV